VHVCGREGGYMYVHLFKCVVFVYVHMCACLRASACVLVCVCACARVSMCMRAFTTECVMNRVLCPCVFVQRL